MNNNRNSNCNKRSFYFVQALFLIPATMAYIDVQSREYLPLTISRWPTLFGEVCVCFFVYDAVYYVWHYAHHKIPFLYKHVHSVNHQYQRTFSIVAQHVHPIELITTGLIALGIPRLFNCHPVSTWVFLALHTYLRVDSYSGYSFPWQLCNIIPYYGGSLAVGTHHVHEDTNYQLFFTFIDRLLGTYKAPKKDTRAVSGSDTIDNRPISIADPCLIFRLFFISDLCIRYDDLISIHIRIVYIQYIHNFVPRIITRTFFFVIVF